MNSESSKTDDVEDEDDQIDDEPIPFHALAPAIEFCCWVVVALCPFLRWVNGAAVTRDQFWIQVSNLKGQASNETG